METSSDSTGDSTGDPRAARAWSSGRARPAPGWLAGRSTMRFVVGGFHEEDFEIWDSTGVLGAQSHQLALLP